MGSRDERMENPNLQDQPAMSIVTPSARNLASGEVFMGFTEPPYGNASETQAAAAVLNGQATPARTPPRREPMSSSTPTSATVRVQEFYTAQQTPGQEGRDVSGVRWIARFTEFLRTTATRGAMGMDRMMDNLGLNQPNVTNVTQGGAMVRASNMQFSPPEHLPQTPDPRGPPIPSSWAPPAATAQSAPLFSSAQMAQFRQAQAEYPHIYGPYQGSDVESERSSRLQAEIQRQLEEYKVKHQAELTRLQQEVQSLRAEREGRAVTFQQDNIANRSSSTVPQGNPQQLPHEGPPVMSEGIEESQQYPPNVHGSSTVPPGNPQQLPQDGPGPVCEGQSSGLGVGLSHAPNVPRHSQQKSFIKGDGVPNDVPRTHGQGLYDVQSSTIPRGNPQQLPQDGPFYFSHARGQESGPFVSHARGQESGTAADVNQREGVESEAPGKNPSATGTATTNPSAQQWLGGSSPTDPMTLLAGGMAQIQAVMLKQMQEKDREKDEDKSPETVKPGTTSLPALADVNPQTSSVDIMDWLEVITSTMQDLSDGSTVWWAKVRLLANKSYSLWTSASPVDKLNILPPKDDELESGRWSRVNSRASSMITMALSDAVRQEMVQRRSTGSATSLIFRLLCLYQPGGQQEKVTILQSLQQLEPEVTAQRLFRRGPRRTSSSTPALQVATQPATAQRSWVSSGQRIAFAPY